MALATQSYPFTSILDSILALLPGARIFCAPDDSAVHHVAQNGIRIRVSPPEPVPSSGAGRRGYIVMRRLEVFVLTQSLADPGGFDDSAVRAHVTAEETVVNALTLVNSPKWITLKFIPGGTDIARTLKTAPSIMASVLVFELTYPAPLTV